MEHTTHTFAAEVDVVVEVEEEEDEHLYHTQGWTCESLEQRNSTRERKRGVGDWETDISPTNTSRCIMWCVCVCVVGNAC